MMKLEDELMVIERQALAACATVITLIYWPFTSQSAHLLPYVAPCAAAIVVANDKTLMQRWQ